MSAWAFVVGINEYDPNSGLTPLHGAVADAADFADWALDPQGGKVDPARLYLWTWPAAAALTAPVAAALANAPDWVNGPPDFKRAPRGGEIRGTLFNLALDASSQGVDRLYVFFAGHGLQTQPLDYRFPTQICFLAGDYLPHFATDSLVAGVYMRSIMRRIGPVEVIMFFDCCRSSMPLNESDPPVGGAMMANQNINQCCGIGLAAQPGSVAHETPVGSPTRGAFTRLLTFGLRNARYGDKLTALQLESYLRSGIARLTAPHSQMPTIDLDPRDYALELATGPPIDPPPDFVIDLSGRPPDAVVIVRYPDLSKRTLAPRAEPYIFPAPLGLYAFETPEEELLLANLTQDRTRPMLSSPEPGPQPREGVLIAEGGAGVVIEIYDANFLPIAQGVQRLEAKVQEGMYTVRFNTAGRSEDQIVRLLPRSTPLVVTATDLTLPSASPSMASDSSALERAQSQAVESFAAKRPPPAADHQELIVFVRAPDARTRADVARSLRLFDMHSVKMRSDLERAGGESDANNDLGWAARRYAAPAGCYSLRYESMSRRRIEQTICLFPGRRTFAFLEYGATVQVEQSGDGYRRTWRRGVDPSQSVLISAPSSTAAPDASLLRLADILLHALKNPRSPLDQGLMEPLMEPSDCPYLKLYAAAAIATRLEWINDPIQWDRSIAPGPETFTTEQMVAWMRPAARNLLGSLPLGNWPDAQCISWRLGALDGDAASRRELAAPPLLDCSWRWAAAHSIDHPSVLPNSGAFAAAATARQAAGPWLVWRSAVERALAPQTETDKESLRPVIEEIANQIGRDGNREKPDARLELEQVKWADQVYLQLSPDAQQTANAVQILATSPGTDIDPRALASLLGTPANTLLDRLGQVALELRNIKFE